MKVLHPGAPVVTETSSPPSVREAASIVTPKGEVEAGVEGHSVADEGNPVSDCLALDKGPGVEGEPEVAPEEELEAHAEVPTCIEQRDLALLLAPGREVDPREQVWLQPAASVEEENPRELDGDHCVFFAHRGVDGELEAEPRATDEPEHPTDAVEGELVFCRPSDMGPQTDAQPP